MYSIKDYNIAISILGRKKYVFKFMLQYMAYIQQNNVGFF